MSEGSNAVVWQCVHCHEELPGVPPGSLPNCPFCKGPQQSPERPLCVNPNCREQLFTPTAEFCHKCNVPQQTSVKQQQTAPTGHHSHDNRKLRTSTQADPSQPPSAIPGTQHSVQEQENITRSGDSTEGESDDTDEFFDALSEFSQVQVASSNDEKNFDATSELQQMQVADSHLTRQHTQLPQSPLPDRTQSSPPPQPSQHLTGATSYLEHPPSSGIFNLQPPGSETYKEPTQEATSNSAPLQGQEPGNQIQLSTTQPSPKKLDSITANGEQSSTLAKHTAPPECTTSTAETPKPPSESTGIPDHPIASHVGGNSEGLHGQKRTDEQRLPDDKSQTDLPEPHEKHKDHANGNGELSSILSQDTTTPPENTTSTTETPGLTSAHDHPLASDFKASNGSQKQTKELSSADKWQMKENDDHPSTDPHGLHEQQEKPYDRGKDSDVANGNGELSSILSKDTTSTTPLKTTTSSKTDTPKPLPDASGVPDRPGIASEDDSASEANERSQKQTTKTDTPAKLSRHEQNKEDTRKELIGKAVDSKQERTPPSQRRVPPKQKPTANANANSTDPILQPASQQMGGSHTGSVTHTALTRLV